MINEKLASMPGEITGSQKDSRQNLETWNVPGTTVCIYLFILFFVFVLIRNAWIAEDAYISFRTMDNFVYGNGLRWNIGERVQTFTHPLWLFFVSLFYYFTREPFYTTIGLSIALSLATVLLFAMRIASTPVMAIFGVITLTLSKSFMDFSTSGLENPLTHALLALFCLVYLRYSDGLKKVFYLSLLAGLMTLNRMDTILLCLPALAFAVWQGRTWRSLPALALGFAPFAVWELFSIFYYGFPFPNTAYAKLHTGIGSIPLMQQGALYLVNSMDTDPLTLFIIAGALVLVLLRKQWSLIALAAGILLNLVYIVRIGGDFMSGRFLSAAFLCALILISQLRLHPPTSFLWALPVVILLGFCASTPTPLVNSAFGKNIKIFDNKGVADEHAFYNQGSSLLRVSRWEDLLRRMGNIFGGFATWNPQPIPSKNLKANDIDSTKVMVTGPAGFPPFYFRPDIHVIDFFALADPLMARLPATAERTSGTLCLPPWLDWRWRVGHYKRKIPDGYLQTLNTGKNKIRDKNIAQYYDKLRLITRGDLLDKERLKTIVKMNRGDYEHLISPETYWKPYLRELDISQVQKPKKADARWDEPGNFIFKKSSAFIINLHGKSHAARLEASFDHNDSYEIVFIESGKRIVGREEVHNDWKESKGLRLYTLPVPRKAIREGYRQIIVFPITGDGCYSMGHLRLCND